MTNKEIAKQFKTLAQVMELLGESPYKTRAYQNAYQQLRKVSEPLKDMDKKALKSIKGVGDAIANKIVEMTTTGVLGVFEKYAQGIPKGVLELLNIDGLGTKKVKIIWQELGIESVGELLYACQENRILQAKGFGKKTQENLQTSLEYYLHHQSDFRYDVLEKIAHTILDKLSENPLFTSIPTHITGALRRKMPTADKIELLMVDVSDTAQQALIKLTDLVFQRKLSDNTWLFVHPISTINVYIHFCTQAHFGSALWHTTGGNESYLETMQNQLAKDVYFETEEAVFEAAQQAYVLPELRDYPNVLSTSFGQLIEVEDLKGALHIHSKYSDGVNTISQLAKAAKKMGFSYLGMSDHSRSAVYANGLTPDRLETQWEEIEALNAKLKDFKIYKGIESDILGNGDLDYPKEILEQFDFIIASIHSHLRMDEEKAMMRLINAIENPYTNILGHPTGRLLLSRKGYPVNMPKIIDACAQNQVAIELNANPHRLDIDYTWIPLAIEKGVKIAINPDAHSLQGLEDVHYGIGVARKGGLSISSCLNCLDCEQFEVFIKK